jgi:hypothetical protein
MRVTVLIPATFAAGARAEVDSNDHPRGVPAGAIRRPSRRARRGAASATRPAVRPGRGRSRACSPPTIEREQRPGQTARSPTWVMDGAIVGVVLRAAVLIPATFAAAARVEVGDDHHVGTGRCDPTAIAPSAARCISVGDAAGRRAALVDSGTVHGHRTLQLRTGCDRAGRSRACSPPTSLRMSGRVERRANADKLAGRARISRSR